uniref:Putative ovule protein n=1 Tax=Solanum chacoense TaxID=4108 RepID=A0A0V0IVE5_SOLCH
MPLKALVTLDAMALTYFIPLKENLLLLCLFCCSVKSIYNCSLQHYTKPKGKIVIFLNGSKFQIPFVSASLCFWA